MNERKLDHGSRINTADEDTLERSVGSNMFEILNDCLVSKPVTPSAAARSPFALRIDTRKIRDILLDGFVRSPHRHNPRASSRSGPASREDPVSEFLLPSLPWRWFPRSLGLGPRTRQRHAAEAMPVAGTAAGPFRASLSRACGQL